MTKFLIAFGGRLQEEHYAQCVHQPDYFLATYALTVSVLLCKIVIIAPSLDSQHRYGLINATGSE